MRALVDEGNETAPGDRNDTLNRAAFALGQLVGDVLLDQHIARDELLSAAARIGLRHTEAERTITSGLSAGARYPRQRTELDAARRRTASS